MHIVADANSIKSIRSTKDHVVLRFETGKDRISIKITKFRLHSWICSYLRDRLGWWLREMDELEKKKSEE